MSKLQHFNDKKPITPNNMVIHRSITAYRRAFLVVGGVLGMISGLAA